MRKNKELYQRIMEDVTKYLKRRLNEDVLDSIGPIEKNHKYDVITPNLKWASVKTEISKDPSPEEYDMLIWVGFKNKVKKDSDIDKLKNDFNDALRKFYNTCHNIEEISELTLMLYKYGRLSVAFKLNDMTAIECIDMCSKFLIIMNQVLSDFHDITFHAPIHERKYWSSQFFTIVDSKDDMSFPRRIFSSLIGPNKNEVYQNLNLLIKRNEDKITSKKDKEQFIIDIVKKYL